MVDLSSTEPRKGQLLYYLGPARITIMNTTISPDNTELNDEECFAIESVRHSHEDFLKAVDPTVKTIALTFKVNGRAFASIASVSLKTGLTCAACHTGRFTYQADSQRQEPVGNELL